MLVVQVIGAFSLAYAPVRTHLTIYFHYVGFVVCQLDLDKPVIKSDPSPTHPGAILLSWSYACVP